MVYMTGKYFAQDKMSDLICNNYPMLLVMSRFGINLGFGEDTIEDVCRSSKVDLYTFLSVVNMLGAVNKTSVEIDPLKVSLLSLVGYLHKSHTYFLEYRMPTIRRELIEAIKGNDDVAVVIVNYFDKYVEEVHKHMMYEEQTLFPYIYSVISDSVTDAYSVEVFSKHHDKVEAKLSELKNIIIKYYPSQTTNELNNVLYDIFSCEADLASHNSIEDFLLVPTIKALEKSKGGCHE